MIVIARLAHSLLSANDIIMSEMEIFALFAEFFFMVARAHALFFIILATTGGIENWVCEPLGANESAREMGSCDPSHFRIHPPITGAMQRMNFKRRSVNGF
jgi:hypothetical protein